MSFLYIFLIIFGTFAISFALINLRQIFTGNEFRGTCSSNNPMLADRFGNCSVCGKGPDEICDNSESSNKSKGMPSIGTL